MKKRITRDSTDMTKYAGTCIEMAEPPVRHLVVKTAIRTGGGEMKQSLLFLTHSTFQVSTDLHKSRHSTIFFKSKLRSTML